MTRPAEKTPRLALGLDEAAAAIGLSRVVRVGRRIVVPVRELEKWLDRQAARPLEGDLR